MKNLNLEDLNTYVEHAVRTESKTESLTVNPQMLGGILALFMASGRMLDQVKKHMFYGSEYNLEKYGSTLAEEYVNAVNGLDMMQRFILEPNDQGEVEISHKMINNRMVHGLFGIATEATELIEAVVPVLEGSKSEIDSVNVFEEIGDVSWYIAILMDEFEQDWGKVLETNIKKLEDRYPDKFNQHDAEERDLETERKILEK